MSADLARQVSRICDAIVAGSSPARVLDLLLVESAGLLGADAAALSVSDGEVMRVIAASGGAGPLLGRAVPAQLSLSRALPDYELAHRLPVHQLASPNNRLLADAGYAWVALAVVLSDPGSYYALGVFERIDAPEPTQQQRETLRALCGICAAVLSVVPLDDRAVQRFSAQTEPVRLRARTSRDEERDEQLAVLAHELRTPVTVVQGFADTVANRWDDLSATERRESVGVIRDRAHQLRRLLDRLLAGTRPVRDDDRAAATELDLRPVLLAAVRRFAGPGEERPMHTRVPVDPLPVLADEAALASVLDELLTNAGKYSEPTAPIEVSAEVADAETVLLGVHDRGIGIRQSDRERVFLQFWQGEPSMHRSAGGVGLGLFLVRRTVEAQGGSVAVVPREGGGTSVLVRLRRAGGH